MKKYLKSLLCGVICFILGSALTVSAGTWINAYKNDEITIVLNDRIQEFKDETTNEIQYPLTYEGRTYLPLRTVANLVGLKVDYDDETKTAYLETEDYSRQKDIVYSAYSYQGELPNGDYLDIEIPHINIASDAVNELNKKYEELIKTYKEYMYELNDNNMNRLPYSSVFYSAFYNNYILSLVVKYHDMTIEGNSIDKVDVYNINMLTGELMSNNEFLKKLGESEVRYDEIKDLYQRSFEEANKDYFENNGRDEKTTNYYNNILDNYLNNVPKDIENTKFYCGNNKEAHIIVEMPYFAGSSSYYYYDYNI